jgi:hypothetical protein
MAHFKVNERTCIWNKYHKRLQEREIKFLMRMFLPRNNLCTAQHQAYDGCCYFFKKDFLGTLGKRIAA